MAVSYIPYSGPIVTRAEAKEAALPRYFTGNHCYKGHLSRRQTKDAWCETCSREYQVHWRQINIEKARSSTKKYRNNNIEMVRLAEAKYRNNNRDVTRAASRKHRINNPMLGRIYASRRRVLIKNAGGNYTKRDIFDLFDAQKGKCVFCKTKLTWKITHIDHVVPLVLGGDNSKRNIQLLCADCNMAKGAKHPIDFAQSRGLLL